MPDEGAPASTYRFNEGELALDVPGLWADETLNVLRMPGDGQATASLVVTREALPLGQDVAGYVASELKRLRTTLPEFQEIGSTPLSWPDSPGEAHLTRWRSKDGLMDQITACRQVARQRLLIFTATHPTPMPSATYGALVEIISSFRPREDGRPE